MLLLPVIKISCFSPLLPSQSTYNQKAASLDYSHVTWHNLLPLHKLLLYIVTNINIFFLLYKNYSKSLISINDVLPVQSLSANWSHTHQTHFLNTGREAAFFIKNTYFFQLSIHKLLLYVVSLPFFFSSQNYSKSLNK